MATSDFKPIGSTGLNVQGGRVYDEYLRELQGDRWRRIVPTMQVDDTIGSILFVAKMLIRQADRIIEASELDTNDEVKKFVEGCFDDMKNTWSNILTEILSMLPWGFSSMVFTAKRRRGMDPGYTTDRATGIRSQLPTSKFDDGKVGWLDWSIRAQDTIAEWVFADDDTLLGFWQVAPPKYQRVFIPIERTLLFRTESNKDNPEGESIIRTAYDSWYYKRNFMRAEGIFAERLSGLPVASVPASILSPDANATEKAILESFKDIVTNVRLDEQMGIVKPSDRDDRGNLLYDFQLLTSGGQPYDFDKTIMRYSRNIATTVAAQFIYLGQGETGSWALSSDQTNLFSTALGAILRSIEDTVNRVAIPPLLRWNGIPLELAPKLKFGDIERVSMKDLADYIQKMTGANVIIPDDELEKHVRQQADLPEPAEPRKPPMAALSQAPGQDGAIEDKPAASEENTKQDDEQQFSEAAMLQAAARILARGW